MVSSLAFSPRFGARQFRRARAFLALACISGALTACGSSDGDAGEDAFFQRVGATLDNIMVEAPVSQRAAGQVYLDAPVAGATVELRLPSGDLLAQARSDDSGFFVLPLPGALPRDFFVVATGGMASGQPVEGPLLMVQDDFDRLDGVLHVTVLTTLAAHVLDAGLRQRPGYTPADAAADVRRYLGLLDSHDLRDNDVREFDVEAFLRAQGGVPLDIALPRLAEDILADPSLTQPYRGILLGASFEEEMAISIGASLARRGLNYLARFDHPVTERISGWGLAALNWAKPDYAGRLDQIDGKLREISGDLTIIQNQVRALDRKMETGFQQVQQAIQALSDQQYVQGLYNSYANMQTATSQSRATVTSLHRRYMMLLAAGGSPELPALLADLSTDIIRQASEAIVHLRLIQEGSGTPLDSAAAVWYRLQAITNPDYPLTVNSDFFDVVNQQQDQVAGLQLLALNLLLEAYNYEATKHSEAATMEELRTDASPLARAVFANHSEDIEATQKLVAYPRIDPGLLANLYTGRLHVRYGAAMRLENGCARLHLSWRELGTENARDFHSPGNDCDFNFLHATPAFNAMKPFGFDDWAISEMPTFRWQRGNTNLAVAQDLGYDFSAILSYGPMATSGHVIGVHGDLAATRFGLTTVGIFSYFNPPLSTLQQLQQAHSSPYQTVFFSRPIDPDPLALRCSGPDGWTIRCRFD
ncbi:hypothetical protein V8Z80_11050 [Orrella sp. JC864]|uniref:hypothetical protein n=1 Tax=Orrella sp. JC864 TaxID=3120298 RepID=UPI00300B1EF2